MKRSINVLGTEINLISNQDQDYINLTDIARSFEGEAKQYIQNWLRNGSTIEYLGEWEKLYNSDFKVVEFNYFKLNYTKNSFLMSVKKWTEKTGAVGLKVKRGKYGGTFAHNEIALHFASWLSPKFQIYLFKEFKRLKASEAIENRNTLEWNVKRLVSKANYHIHTEAIKRNLIPNRIKKSGFVYASEADLLNLALFGMTAKTWKIANSTAKGNVRDNATIEQLIVLANLETHNAEFIREGLTADERLDRLNQIAIEQLQIIMNYSNFKNLKEKF